MKAIRTLEQVFKIIFFIALEIDHRLKKFKKYLFKKKN